MLYAERFSNEDNLEHAYEVLSAVNMRSATCPAPNALSFAKRSPLFALHKADYAELANPLFGRPAARDSCRSSFGQAFGTNAGPPRSFRVTRNDYFVFI